MKIEEGEDLGWEGLGRILCLDVDLPESSLCFESDEFLLHKLIM